MAHKKKHTGGAQAHRDSRLRVLVVDDNIDLVAVFEKILHALGHDVEKAYDGVEALVAAREFEPDVIFLDIGMPKKDGYETAREMRNDPKLRHIRLVALSGYGQEKDRARTKEAGFDEHMVKPIRIEQIKEILERPRKSA